MAIFSNFLIFAQETFSDSLKTILLSEHNFYRHVVGANDLIWSEVLEQKAENYATDIAQNPNFYSKDTSYGVNMYRSIETPNPVLVVKSWANEQRYYYGQEITQTNLFVFQHYTQIIWKQTVSLGCAMAKTKGKLYIVVCLYNPRGNLVGMKPLEN